MTIWRLYVGSGMKILKPGFHDGAKAGGDVITGMNKERYVSFLESELKSKSKEDSLFHIIPAPYEASVSYGKGAAKGPSAILEASQHLELFDGVSIPAEHGIYTHHPIACHGKPEKILQELASCVSQILVLNKIPIVLGGEHTVTLGALQAIKKEYKRFGVIQFDAHADLRNTYEGNPFSHACVMQRILDLGLPVYQIGVRSLSNEEAVLRSEKKIGHLDAVTIFSQSIPETILPDDFPSDIYITIDVDVFDPSLIPSTGTPEPGGLNWYQTMQLLTAIICGRNVIGFDIVELAPISQMHAPDYTIARLLYNFLGVITRNFGD